MSREDILKKVNEIFWDVIDDDTIEVVEETTAADIEDWDSLTHITLISAMDHADAAPEIPEEADAVSSKRGWRWTFSAPACMMGGEAEGEGTECAGSSGAMCWRRRALPCPGGPACPLCWRCARPAVSPRTAAAA